MANDIPDGWVPLASFDERKDKKRSGESGEYAAVRKAIHAGLIDSMSVGRPRRLYVREVQAEGYLNTHFRNVCGTADSELSGRIDALWLAVRDLQNAYQSLRDELS